MQTRPTLGFARLWNISFGFFGIQIGFALQNANASRIFQSLGTPIDQLGLMWIAAPLTGLLVQPLIGHYSDRTWGRLGRRRPYFLIGAILCTCALFFMPNAPGILAAAITLWILDASLNVSMEPFRAFVGDMLAPGSGRRAMRSRPGSSAPARSSPASRPMSSKTSSGSATWHRRGRCPTPCATASTSAA